MFDKIKYYYGKGLYKKPHLTVLLSAGAISAAEYNEILKGEFNG